MNIHGLVARAQQLSASLTLCKALLLGSGHPTTLEGGGAAHTRPLSLLGGLTCPCRFSQGSQLR